MIPREEGYESDSNSDDDNNDCDEDDDNADTASNNQSRSNTEEMIEHYGNEGGTIGFNARNQGADDHIEDVNVEEEVVVEDVTGEDIEPPARSSGRPGLKRITTPAESHRNRYEREFQNDTVESFDEKSSYLTLGKRKIQPGKLRSGLYANRWANNKKRKCKAPRKSDYENNMKDGMSKLMDVIMLNIGKDNGHTQVSVN